MHSVYIYHITALLEFIFMISCTVVESHMPFNAAQIDGFSVILAIDITF